VAGLHTALLLCFYLEPLQEGDIAAAAELAFKAGFLLASAWVVGGIGSRERGLRLDLQRRQAALDAAFEETRSGLKALQRTHQAQGAALHRLASQLSVILGSDQLLLETGTAVAEQRPDLLRILDAARECARATRRLLVESHAARRPPAAAADCAPMPNKTL